jgi:hypothetical protein
MPYGTMDKATEDILRQAGIDPETIEPPEDATVAFDISIIFDGALDESFLIDADRIDRYEVVDAIADALFESYPDNEVLVAASHVYIGEDLIEGSGYTDFYYERRGGVMQP